MLVSDLSFRDIEHHYFLLPLQPEDANIRKICKDFPGTSKANVVLLYGYIDHEAGITFELLSTGILKGEKVSLYDGNDEWNAKIRCGSIADHEIYPQEGISFDPYQDKVHFIDTDYKVSKEVEALRLATELDPYRHPLFPDDLAVIFIRKGSKPEQCWVRCSGITDDGITGILLNEPNADLGIHRSDEITFGVMEQEDKTLLPICCMDK